MTTNNNEETTLTNEGFETNMIDNQQGIIGQVMDNSDELRDLNDAVENGVGDVLGDGEAVKTLEEKYAESLNELKRVQDQIKTLTSVAATSQSQYLSLKSEFDSAQRMRSLEKARDKVSAIIAIAKKFTILLQDMKNFISHLTPDLEENTLIK
jgi:chromosome segregation ATPase